MLCGHVIIMFFQTSVWDTLDDHDINLVRQWLPFKFLNKIENVRRVSHAM